MSPRSAAWLAWSLAALSMGMFLASVAFFVLARAAQAEGPGSLVTSRSIIDLLVSVPFLAFPIVGALIASRRPHNPIGWICLAVGYCGCSSACSTTTACTALPSPTLSHFRW